MRNKSEKIFHSLRKGEISLNDAREKYGLERIPNEEYDQLYVSKEYVEQEV